jgi:hypothetical protein
MALCVTKKMTRPLRTSADVYSGPNAKRNSIILLAVFNYVLDDIVSLRGDKIKVLIT